jgi:ParB/RepB/Spo0J family partition protein
MNTQSIPLKSIVADKSFNVRKNLAGIVNADPRSESDKDTSIEKLASEIRRDGLINPMVVRIDENGKYLLIAGFRRHAALTMLAKEDPAKYASAEVRVYDGDISGAYFLNVTENTARNDLTPFEIGERCYFIRNESKKWNKDGKELSINAIADRVGGHSRSYISNLIRAFSDLHPALLKRWEQESTGGASDKVRYMLTDRINRLIAEKDKDKQLDLQYFDGLSWNEVKAGVKKEDKAETKGDSEKGDKSAGVERPSAKVLTQLMEFAKSDSFKGEDKEATLLVNILKFVLGEKKTIFGFDPVKMAELEKAEKEAERAALKEQKEAEKLAARDEKHKAKIEASKKNGKETRAEA